MKILDRYILKRYLVTFLFSLLILMPIAIAIDVSEKINKFLSHQNLTVYQIIDQYYKNFIIYYVITFMPLAVFIATVFFTSKLANNTEIVAINSSRISFNRFLYPYFIGATIIVFASLMMNHFVVPSSNKVRKNFEKNYFKRKKYEEQSISNFSLQLNDSTYLFFQNYNLETDRGYNFSMEIYHNLQLKHRLTADNFHWKKKDSIFELFSWKKRTIFRDRDSIFSGNKIDTTFAFTPKDFVYKLALAQEMTSGQLSRFIDRSRKRGVKNVNAYLVELYNRSSLPFATYVLTFIAVVLASEKRRGGMGINLALGVGIMFIYVFFLKVAGVLGAVAEANSLLYVWMPNIIFGIVALCLYYRRMKK